MTEYKQNKPCGSTKPCTWDCWDWFRCCGYGKHPEKCYRYNKRKKLKNKSRESGDKNGKVLKRV